MNAKDVILARKLGGGGGGGATITDGIVVKARDTDGYATEVDFYGTTVEALQFGQGSNNRYGFLHLSKVNYMNECTAIKASGFSNCHGIGAAPIPPHLSVLEANAFAGSWFDSAELPLTLTDRLFDNAFSGCPNLKSIRAPGITSLDTLGGTGNGQFLNDTALETVEIGSIGYAVTYTETWNFRSCTQTGLTITIYTTGAYADTALANCRNGATNATIIIKAAEGTTYNGTDYAAGDTMITSTVEEESA